MGQDRSLDIAVLAVDGRDARVTRRLADHGGLERAGGEEALRNRVFQARQYFGFEHGFHLARRTGQKNEQLAMAVVYRVKILPRRGARTVGQRLRAFEHIALLGVVVGDRHAPGGEARIQRRHDLLVALEAQAESLSHGFAGQVVFCRPQAAPHDHNIRTLQRRMDGGNQMLAAIADDRLGRQANAQLLELRGEIQRVGVLAVGRQHL
jgi:hypothetical protein